MKKKLPIIMLFVLSVFILYASNINLKSLRIPILTYHDITIETALHSGQVTKDRFLEDMTYLKEEGYTSLLTSDLEKIMNREMELPKKPVVITFDDGYLGNYLHAYEVLKETEQKAIIGLITSNIREVEEEGNPNFMTFAQCKEMYDSGYVDIQNHTHDLHNREFLGLINPDGSYNGIQMRDGETVEAYQERLYTDLHMATQLIEEHVGSRVIYFAYPYGATDKNAYAVLEETGLQMATTIVEGVADFNRNIHNLKRRTVTMERSVEELLGSTYLAFDLF
ncbi:MAG: polysaccharide deacetylase family protein [Bacillota bacterium]